MTRHGITWHGRPARGSRGFTLTEIVVVVVIIVLVLAMVVPVVSSVVGSRSFEAGYNRLSAVLGHARQTALFNRAPVGVAFFIDPLTGREDVAYVARDPAQTDPRYFDVVPGEEVASLPPGLAVQTLTNGGSDRYLPFGLILFDENGQLASLPYFVSKASTLGGAARMNLTSDLAPPTAAALYSHLGFCLYDRQSYVGQVKPGGTSFDDATISYSTYFGLTAPVASDKQAEEAWLDANGQVMAVKPNDGSLLRNQ